MSDTDNEELERIRERKRERLRERRQSDSESSDELDDSQSSDTTPVVDEPVEVSGLAELERVVSEHDLVLVDCYADWCGPCKMMEPVVEELAATTDAVIAKVDVDANQEVAAQLGARSIPTFVLFVDGEPTERLVGAQDRATFEQLFAQA